MLEPMDIRKCWERILPGLLAVKDKCQPEWKPEDVYHACRNGDARAFVAPDCFAILKKQVNEFTGEKELFVWIAHGEGFVQDKGMKEIRSIARGMGAVRIEMHSPRKGFERTGWTPVATVYQMEVDP